jgi:predicted transcriptional regulator
LKLSVESKEYWEKWQQEREEQLIIDNDSDSMQIFSRLNPAVIKLVMLFELGSPDFDPNKPMRLEFMVEACRLVDEYFMHSAKAAYDIVGSNVEKNVIDKITSYLKNNGGKVTSKQLQNHMKLRQRELNEYVNSMKEYGMIEEREVKTGKAGRPSAYVFLVSSAKPLSSTI